MKTASAFVALLLLAGCTLLDTEPTLRLVVVSGDHTRGPIVVRVETGGVKSARIVVDGHELQDVVPIATDYVLPLDQEGAFRIYARAYRGASVQETAPIDCVIDRSPPRVLTFAPPVGPARSWGPFEVVVTFDEAIDPASVTEGNVGLVSQRSPGGPVPVTIAQGPDPRVVTIRAAVPLGEIDEVSTRLAVRDLAGNVVIGGNGFWWAPGLDVTWTGLTTDVSGTVELRASWSAVTPATVTVDGQPLATGVLNGQLVPWDTTTVANGPHEIALSVPGYHAPASRLPFVVDNTPPSLLGCAVHPDAPSSSSFVDVTFDRPVRVKAAGSPSPYCGATVSVPMALTTCAAGQRFDVLPVDWLLDFTGTVSAAGLPLAGARTCTVTVPPWLEPFGAGPLTMGVLPVTAWRGTLAFQWYQRESAHEDRLSLLHLEPDGTISYILGFAPGVVRGSSVFATGASQLGVSADLRTVTWVESASSGAEVAVRNRGGVLATRPAAFDVALVPASGWGVAWTELGGDGLRRLYLSIWDYRNGVWAVTPEANLDAASSVVSAAVSNQDVALVEMGADGVGRLRVRAWDGGAWVTRGGILNADAARSASQPALGDPNEVPVVAWVEGEQVLVSSWDGLSWTVPEVLSSPGVSARSPLLVDAGGRATQAFFIERVDGVDRIAVRERVLTTDPWKALPSLETGGLVDTFEVSPWPLAILWRDGGGAVRIRVHTDN